MAVVCRRCEQILEENIGETEYKLCPRCVAKSYPEADKNRIQSIREQAVLSGQVNGNKPDLAKLAERLKSLELEFEFEEVDGEVKVVFHLKDYFKKDFFIFALGEKHLEDFLHDIKEIKKEKEE